MIMIFLVLVFVFSCTIIIINSNSSCLDRRVICNILIFAATKAQQRRAQLLTTNVTRMANMNIMVSHSNISVIFTD